MEKWESYLGKPNGWVFRSSLSWLWVGLATYLFTLPLQGDDRRDTQDLKWFGEVTACYHGYAGIRADFIHESISANGAVSEPMSGQMQVAVNGRFRMTYQSPQQSEIVFDGKKVRGFDFASGMVIEQVGKSGDLFQVISQLHGKSTEKLLAQFRVRILQESTDETQRVIELVPLERDPLIQKMIVTTGACPAIRRVIVVDWAGNLVRLTLQNIQLVTEFPKGVFYFRVPNKVQVVRP